MLHVWSEEDKANDYHNGMCAVCMEEIRKRYYWRCPDAKCGDKEGGGRLCTKCHDSLVDKSRCTTCRQAVSVNPITDPTLLPYLFHDTNKSIVSVSFVMETVRRLIGLGFVHVVLDHALTSPMMVSTIRELAILEWYLFPLEQLQLMYAKIEPTIILRLSGFATDIGWNPVCNAAKKRPEWLLKSARWLIAWRNQRRCVAYVDSRRRSDVMDGEPQLLAICQTPEEFGVLREFASGETDHDRLDFDVIIEHLRFGNEYHGKQWVFDRLFAMIGDGNNLDQETKGKCISNFRYLARMFPCEKLYRWAAKHFLVVTGYHVPDFGLAVKCGIAPILYGCHSKGLYAQTNRLTLEPVLIGRHDHDKDLYISPNVDKRVLYVDCSCDSMRLDWTFGASRKMHLLDATGTKCRVDICGDGVELYLDDVQLVTHFEDNLPLKITRFASLTLRSALRNKRKLRFIE